MNRWKKGAMAAALAVLILMGTWGGLLAGQRSAQTLGRTEQALPRIRLEQEGGVRVTFGSEEWRAEPRQVREVFSALGKVEWMMPHSLRVTGLAALSSLWWVQREPGHVAGQKRLVDAPVPPEGKDKGLEKV